MWFALLLRPQKELKVAETLRQQGHEVFVPIERVIRRSRYTKAAKETARPIVRGYAFVRTPYIQHDDVRGVLMHDGRPVPISEAAMRPIFLASGRIVDDTAPPKPIAIGDIVRIKEGPFAGRAVTVGRVRGRRIEVILPFFGAEKLVAVARANVSKS